MKTTKWLMMAMFTLFIASCSDSNADLGMVPNQDYGGMKVFSSFTATLGDAADTRAHIVDGSEMGKKHIAWDDQLPIAVFSDLQNNLTPFELTGITDDIGTFEGEKVKGNIFHAIYPFLGKKYNYLDEENPNIIHAFLDDYAWANTFEDFQFMGPMVAESNGNNFNFKQTTGMIHVSFGNVYKINEVVLKGNNREKLSGYGQIDLAEPSPVFIITDEYYDGVYELREWFCEETDGGIIDIYFVIPPTIFKNGFNLQIETEDEDGNEFYIEKDFSKEISVGRATVKHFSLIDVYAELEALEEEAIQAEAETRAILKKFYDALNGDNWYNKDGWLQDDVPLSEWYGLRVDNNGFLTGIDMWMNNLSGKVPDEIGKLTKLTLFSLGENSDSVTIPEELGNLINIKTLFLTGIFMPSFPEWIYNLKKLEDLTLQHCQIGGKLPERLVELTNLHYLNLIYNNFEGEIYDSYFTNLDLWELDLRFNKLSGTITKEQQQSRMWHTFTERNKNVPYSSKYINPQQNGYYVNIENGVTDIILNAEELNLHIGETFQFEATILPVEAIDKTVSWSCRLNDYANPTCSLSNTGFLEAKAEGETWVYATSKDGSDISTVCHVTVVSGN